MIENIQNNPIAQAMGRCAMPHPEGTNKPAANGLDATLQVRFADLINQAIQGSDAEADAVQKARELLKSGQLTSLENIRSAAQNMLTSGI